MHVRLKLTVLGAVLVSGWPEPALAQALRGTVHDGATRAPLPGVLVVLIDSAGREVQRALTEEQGSYRLSVGRSGTFRVRIQRIGFRPVLSDPIVLSSHHEVTVPPLVAGAPVRLDIVRVVDRRRCEARPDSARTSHAVWLDRLNDYIATGVCPGTFEIWGDGDMLCTGDAET